jgi:CHAD domain-containing protein
MGDGNANLLLEAVEKGWNEFQIRFKLYRHEASEESVHDLRVASRRLLSVI